MVSPDGHRPSGAGISHVSACVPGIGAFMCIYIITFKVLLHFLGVANFTLLIYSLLALMKFDFALSHSRRIVDQSQQSFSCLSLSVHHFKFSGKNIFPYLQLLLPMHNTCYQVLIYIVASKRAVINLMKELTEKKP